MLRKIYRQHNWKESFAALMQRQVWHMLLLGFSAGLPLLLIFSSLSLWLREAGIEKSAVTYFSWAALGYSFKFIWAPLVDRLPVPILTRVLGLRRSWLLVSQLSIAGAIFLMAFSDPSYSDQLSYMAMGAVLLGFSSATQDISIDAYRIEAGDADLQGLMSASYVAGYRVGMIVAGAGALYIASYFGTSKEQYSYTAWQYTYQIMASFMLVGISATFLISEPIKRNVDEAYSTQQYLGLLLTFALSVGVFIFTYMFTSDVVDIVQGQIKELFSSDVFASVTVGLMRFVLAVALAIQVARLCLKFNLVDRALLQTSYVEPIKNFFDDYGLKTAGLLLALIGLYRISDIVLGVVSNLFYQDLGFTKIEIADAVKTFGLVMTIFGGFVGGVLAMRLGVMRILFVGAVLVIVTNLLFIVLFYTGKNITIMYLVVAADNLVAGLASAAFVAFLSSLVNIQFTAMQYAIFSSLMTLIPKTLAGYSGTVVDLYDYDTFFVIAAALGVPVLVLIYYVNLVLEVNDDSSEDTSKQGQPATENDRSNDSSKQESV